MEIGSRSAMHFKTGGDIFMSKIQVMDLTFEYEGSFDLIFNQVSFTIDTDWKIGFIGRNGRGKTSFLNLLMGKFPYQGTIASSVAFDYFPFAVSDQSLDTIRILYQISNDWELWEVIRELHCLDVSEEVLYRPFYTLSQGEQTKVLLAALFLKQNNFLLIDEPTNHLDMQARIIVSKYLNSKKGFLLVSHDRTFLDSCIDHVLSINRANIEIQKGNFTSWQENKQMQDEFEQDENEKLEREIRSLTAASKRTAKWSEQIEKTKIGASDKGYVGHKAAKMMKRSKAIENRRNRAMEEKSQLLKNIEKAETLKLPCVDYPKKTLIEAEQLQIFYGKNVVVQDLSFALQRGERIALAGKNGSGKSSLLKLILGHDISHSGQLKIGNGLAISYVPQDTSSLKGGIFEFARNEGIDETLFLTILRKLDFSRVQFEKNMTEFSEGQKKKVLIAKSLCQKAHLYVWDEPLNFIDVLSRIQIEELLLRFQPTMIFVEHDITFHQKIATKTIHFS